MNTIKTLLSTTTIAAAFAFGTVQANGFFSVDSQHKHQKQQSTFNDAAHEGTEFWGYYNKDLSKETPKIDKVSSFDASKHDGTYFWDTYNN